MMRRLVAALFIATLACLASSARATDTTSSSAALDGQLATSMIASGDPRAIYTIVDIAFLKAIATAIEEYSVDHQFSYPATLNDLVPKYLKAIPVVPASPTGARYGYKTPASDPRMGTYVITDSDAQVDAQYYGGHPIPFGIGGPPCKPDQCVHLSFAQAIGVIGSR